VTPHVAQDIREQNGESAQDLTPEPAGSLGVSQATLNATIDGFRMVTGRGGTAENAFNGRDPAYNRQDGNRRDGEHRDQVNYFIGWAENQDDPLVVLVMIEGGGAFQTGSEVTAAPAARALLESYHDSGGSSNRSSEDYAAEVARANRGEGPAGGGSAPVAAPSGVPAG
jgi:penicillin-binding protein 2